jgi:hypothetical protein
MNCFTHGFDCTLGCRYLTLCGRRKVPTVAEVAFQQAEALGVQHNAYTFTSMISTCAADVRWL